MHYLEYYYCNIIKYDLINRFNYKTIENIPKLQTIVCNFGCNTFDFKKLSIALLSLQLITLKKGNLTVASQSNIILKIKKGIPVGCKVLLKKTLMYKFLKKLMIEIFPRTKATTIKKRIYRNNVTYTFNNVFVFKELEKNYMIFNQLQNLQVTVRTSTKTNRELFFLLNSFKFPLKRTKKFCKCNLMVECNLAKIKVKSSSLFFCF